MENIVDVECARVAHAQLAETPYQEHRPARTPVKAYWAYALFKKLNAADRQLITRHVIDGNWIGSAAVDRKVRKILSNLRNAMY